MMTTTAHPPAGASCLVGLLPASGLALRIQPLPCSKEIYPIGFQKASVAAVPRVKTASEHLLAQMRRAGVRKAYVVVRRGKWDIPAYLGNGNSFGLDLAYLIMGKPFGVPFTLDQAFPFVENATIVFGFPDILIWPEDTYGMLLGKLEASKSDVVLGLYPTEDHRKVDMVRIDSQGRPQNIFIKPRHCDLRYAWLNAVWTPAFSRFMHDFVARFEDSGRPLSADAEGRPGGAEQHLGHVLQAAIKAGLCLSSVVFKRGRFIDIGTPDDLVHGSASLVLPMEG